MTLANDAAPAAEAASAERSALVARVVEVLAQADSDFAERRWELGLTGAAPLVGLGRDASTGARAVTTSEDPTPARPATAHGAAAGKATSAAEPR